MLDTVMDRTVIAGFTNVGFRVRSRAWSRTVLPRLDGKTALVTGASSGLGLATAEGLARLGADVWLVVRDAARGERVRDEIAARTGHRRLHLAVCDLSDLGSVRAFAAFFAGRVEGLHVLVHNAGVMTSERELSPGGTELTLATNVLGPFLLTGLLEPLLGRSAPARIITVSSGGMYTQRLDVDALVLAHGAFDGPTAYARTKRAQVVLTEMWAERLAGTGVLAHAMHPGWVDTPGLRTSLPTFYRATRFLLRTPEQGADTIVWLAAAEEPARSSGGFWHDRRARPTHVVARTRETPVERRRLWQECVRLTGWEPLHAVAPAAAEKLAGASGG